MISSNNKRILKNTLFLYFRMLLLLVISLYTSRIVLRELGVDDFGIYNVVGGIIVIISFVNNAMAGATQRFMNVEMGRKDQEALGKVFVTSLQIHFFVAALVLFLAESVGLWFLNTQMNIPESRMSAANWVYQFSIAATILNIIIVPYKAAVISHEKMSFFAYISIIEALLKLLVTFAIIWSPFDKLIFYASLIFVVVFFNCAAFVAYGVLNFKECKKISLKVELKTMKKMLSFSGWTIFGNLGYILHTQGIAIVVNMFFSVAVNAAQGIANQVNGVVTQFASNFLIALNPQVVKSYAAGEYENLHLLVVRGCKMSFCLLAFFVIPLCLESPMILYVWLGSVPEYAVIFMRLVLLISLVNAFSSLLAATKGATGNIKNYQITLTLIGALHIPLAWIAFAFGRGPEYSMYVYLGIVIVLQIVRIWFVCRSINMSLDFFFKHVIIRCFLVFVLSATMPTLLHVVLNPSIYATIMIGFVSCLGVITSTLYVALTKPERKVIFQLLSSKFLHR